MAEMLLAVVVVYYLVSLTVSLLNYKSRSDPVPENVKGIYDPRDYQRWLDYTMETFRLSVLARTVTTAALVAALTTGLFGQLEAWTQHWFDSGLWQAVAFVGVIYLVSFAAGLPVDYYRTFVIEERYGFNKTTRLTFVLDQVKSLVLMGLLLTFVIAALYTLFAAFADNLWLFIVLVWIVISMLTMVMFVLNTKVFVKVFNKLVPMEEGRLKNDIEALATKLGFEVTAISVMDASRRSTKLNAFFSGLGRTREVVLYDTLVERLSHDEILAVLAHEIGHAIHRDVPRMLVQQIALLGVYSLVIGYVMQSSQLAMGFGLQGINFGFALVLSGIVMTAINLVVSIPVNYWRRRAEYKADAFAARCVGKHHMASALRILARENFAHLTPHPAYVWLNYSHPPIAQRLAALETK